jgi:hypothetical protein
MATDPVERIRIEEREIAIDTDLWHPLRRMADFPASPNVPYLTVRIDWRPDGTRPNSRPGRGVIERKLDEIVAAHEAHTAASAALVEARDKIIVYLDNELAPSVQGVYIVAGGEGHVFVPLALGIPVETDIAVGPVPVLTPLAQLVEDHPAFAVLVADQREAALTIVNQAAVSGALEVEGNEYPRKQQQGGWSQRRYQMRADERISAFARTVAEETQRTLDEAGIDVLIVAGDEVITTALEDAWHPAMKERIAGSVRLDSRATEAEIVEAALPVAERAARERESEAVRQLVDGVGGPLAVGGVEHTLLALEEGRVMTLVLTNDFHVDGWVDHTLPIAGVGDPAGEHPAGGDPAAMLPTAIEEEMIRLALAQDATVEIVHGTVPIEDVPDGSVPQAGIPAPRTEAAELLDGMGGVGAILRYAVVDSGHAMPEA